MEKQKYNLNREGRVHTSSGVTLSGTLSIFKWKKEETQIHMKMSTVRALPLPCGLVVDETLLQCVGKTLMNQRVADEGSSLAQRGFQLTTVINIHTGHTYKTQSVDFSQQLGFSAEYLERVVNAVS